MVSSASSYLCVDNERFGMIQGQDIADRPILPLMDMDQFSNEFNNDEFLSQAMPLNRSDDIETQYHYDANNSYVYPQGNRLFIKSFLSCEIDTDYMSKPLTTWTDKDVINWIIDAALRRKLNSGEIPYLSFKNVTGIDLINMSRDEFYHKMYSQLNPEESINAGKILYEDLQQLRESCSHREKDIPESVFDKFNFDLDENLHNTQTDDCGKAQLLDLDSDYNHSKNHNLIDQIGFTPNGLNCDSGYDSLSEECDFKNPEYDMISIENDSCITSTEQSRPLVIAKRPPGRPKGSGKKHPKRVKNVSVPEFLRDLLLNSKYCPKIIKWEDYSNGKFRFVQANEVAKLWGGKRNNKNMSFEKFSRAMRYHYKQGVLVSVPSARLVYQFGPKAPHYVTSNPNFEPTIGKFNMR